MNALFPRVNRRSAGPPSDYCGKHAGDANPRGIALGKGRTEVGGGHAVSRAAKLSVVASFAPALAAFNCSYAGGLFDGARHDAAYDQRCEQFILKNIETGLVKGRPAANRVDVDEAQWRTLTESHQRKLAAAVRCAAADGLPGELDYGVVHGFQSGDRLAIAAAGRLNVRASARAR